MSHAAVIGLLLGSLQDPSLLLIRRSAAMRQHPGQIAFPGGKPEPEDNDLLDTALREAWEEVGLEREQVRVLGRLTPVPTPTGYMIVPFVGHVAGAWRPTLSGEVDAVLTPKLRTLLEPSIYRKSGTVRWREREWDLHEYAIADPPLWGATARMVWDLLGRIG